jgi:hypothetical protein
MNEEPQRPILVGKLDAARRQLMVAIRLWFYEEEPVSTHTLAHASYEIIHVVSKQRNPSRRDLLFDALMIKDEYRKEFAEFIKKPGNFFKHADRDGELVLEFRPALTELYLLFSIIGVELCGEQHTAEESAYITWLKLHKPDILTDFGRKQLEKAVPVDQLPDARRIPKREFLDAFRTLYAQRGR